MKHFISAVLNILDRKEKAKMSALIVLDLVISVLDIAFLGLLVVIINFYTKNNISNNHLLSQFLPNKNSLLLIGMFFLLFSLKNWLGYVISKSQKEFFYNVALRLSKRNLEHYLEDGYIKFINIDSSIHIRKISQQPIEFSNYILINLQQVISQSTLIFFTIFAILFYHPLLFLLLFLLLMPPVILLAYFIWKKSKQTRVNIKTAGHKTIQHLQEALAGFIESNVYGKNEFFVNRYYAYQEQLNENIAFQQTLQGLPPRLIEVFAVMGLVILVVINKFFTNTPGVDFLNIGVFVVASYKIIPGLIKILNSIAQIKAYKFTIDDLAIDDLAFADSDIVDSTNEPETVSIKVVTFEHIEFNYKEQQVLTNLNFEISAGDFAGISGRSGLGKTTIVNLILGFLKQDNGIIYLNHQPTDSMDRQHYWNRIAYVKQQPFFINDTVQKNITLSDTAFDPGKLAEVISFCGLDHQLDQYPEGINKFITENGKNISGGQRQRIMLARALYHDFDLLILDEPFSEMDECAEKAILTRLQALAKLGKMIIIITHNKSSLSYCNKIISLNEE
ncbi:MAG: hypothetical protein JWR67_1639 [Mucilaginibacter sp.]|nr:hypothetical protein [Mucilaginibacter sp.]